MSYDRKKPTRPAREGKRSEPGALRSDRGEKRNDFGPVRDRRPGSRPWGSKPELRQDRPQGGSASQDQTRKSPTGGSAALEYRGEFRTGGNRSQFGSNQRSPGGDAQQNRAGFSPRGGDFSSFRGDRSQNGGDRVPFRGDRGQGGGSRPPYRGKPGAPAGNRAPYPPKKKETDRPGTTDGMPARRIALEVIRRVTENGAYASLALDEKLRGCTLSGADRRFAARLVYDTLDRLRWLDHALSQVMARPDTDIRLVNVLRLGACQLLLDYRVPENAATDTSVRLCKEIGLEGLAGVCNGILRNLIRKKDALVFPDPAAEPVHALALETSVPDWVAERMLSDWGPETGAALLRWKSRDAGITLRPNLTRLTDEAFRALLDKKVWEQAPGLVPHAVHVRNALDIGEDADWKQGLFSIQSEGSMAACLALNPQRGWRVLDACAAPGGKACFMAELMGNTGRVQAWEKHPHRTELMEAQVRRLRLESVRPMTRDATVRREDLDDTMDAVLLDAPCSGTGDMAEKPDIKLHLTEEKLAELTALQAELLDNVSLAVRPGGVLLYATCSLLRAENDLQIRAFLERHPEFSVEALPETLPESLRQHQDVGLYLLPPRDGIGGFYLCRLRKKALF